MATKYIMSIFSQNLILDDNCGVQVSSEKSQDTYFTNQKTGIGDQYHPGVKSHGTKSH